MMIGFVGTGIMGGPMAAHLQDAGHDLLLYRHRSEPPAALLARGARVVPSLRELAAQADAVITILPDTPDVEDAVFAPAGLAEGLSPGGLLIDMSSISPSATQTIASRLADQGIAFVDAPVSGGEIGAKNASLSIMAGGSEAAFARARPLLALMGSAITHVGPAGHGQIAKVANQIVVALTIQAVAEGLLFASRAGADPAVVREALLGGFAASRVLDVHGQRMIGRTFDPGFRIALHGKDLDLALNNARELGLALPATALAQQLFNACKGLGGSGWDHSALVRALEHLSGHGIGQPNPISGHGGQCA